MKIHVITAVTRPQNIQVISRTLALAAKEADLEYEWHLAEDEKKQHVGGQRIKNAILDEFEDGWVWVLDDDTIVHPDLFKSFALALHDECNSVVVSQMRSDLTVLHAMPSQVALSCIDIGQAILERSLIGDSRIPENYDGDGTFLCRLIPSRTVFIDRILSFHNLLALN